MVSIPAHLRLARMEEGEMLGGEAPQKDSRSICHKNVSYNDIVRTNKHTDDPYTLVYISIYNMYMCVYIYI